MDEAGELYVTTCTCEYERGYDPEANPGGAVWRLVATDQVPEGAETAPTQEAAPEEGEAGADTEGEANVVQVSLVDGAIEMPTSLPAGPTTFEVTNNGTMEHSFEIEGGDIEEVFDENLQPGGSNTLTVDLPAGEYEVYCPVGDHAEQGMQLTLTVTESAPAATQPVTPTAEITPTVEVTPTTAGADVAGVLQAEGLGAFVAALEGTGLAEELIAAGPFTVFAPTDEAFAALPAELLDDPEALAPVLQRHIVVDLVTVADLAELGTALTIQGDSLEIATAADGTISVDGAAIVREDIAAANGIIHVIDTVLLAEE
jgi:uncharacterized surface protein with fasciclin (FAS1) repeats